MATDLEPRKSTSKSEAYLHRKFAEIGARIQRVDLVAHLLALALTVAAYALAAASLDWCAGNSTSASVTALRWTIVSTFLVVLTFFLVQTVRCFFRRVNPYYVAHQLEQTLPDAKNGLINWLDLHEEKLPSAFQKNLSSQAAEQWEDGDTDRMVSPRKIWLLLGVLSLPALGLAVLLILDPAGFLASMCRAFVPFDPSAPPARTLLTLLSPENGDVEVNPTQSVAFAAKIEGRVPIGNRPDAPKLHYRYQADEDYLTLPLQQDDRRLWTAQLPADRIRTGVSYKLSAGDAETPEHQVRVRNAAHVKQFEIAYRHRPYRNLPNGPPSIFPNPHAAKPLIHGPRGSEVEMTVHTSRPIKDARVEFRAKNVKRDLPIERLKSDSHAVRCRFTLEQTGQFRVVYTASDGEPNADREWYPIDMHEDALPNVLLTRPGKDIELPYNGSFVLEGKATSPFGVRALTLHLRLTGKDPPKLVPLEYRPGQSFKLDDGSYPTEAEYMDFVALDQLKDDRGIIRLFGPGDVIEYWLEAADGADYPNVTGTVGRTITYKAKLLAVPVDPKQEEIKRQRAAAQKNQLQKQQDEQRSKDNKNSQKKDDGGGGSNPDKSQKQIQKENGDIQKKLENAHQEPQKDRGGAKGGDPQNADKKDGQGAPDAPQPEGKGKPPPSPDDAGGKKEKQGGGTGESKDGGAKKKDGNSRGERKDGPKDSAGSNKDSGPMGTPQSKGGTKTGDKGMETPIPQPPRDNTAGANAPQPSAKQSTNNDGPSQGNAKGVEQNGPERPTPNQQAAKDAAAPPNLQAKGGAMNVPSMSKSGPSDASKEPGESRTENATAKPHQPKWDDLAKNIDKLPGKDAASDAAAKDLADVAKNADDPRKREIAREALEKNGRDPKTSKRNPYGSGGKSPGIGDDIKATAANREFAARIGQMQLDDWQKLVTPGLLKKAGLSEADWQRYVKNTQLYDTQVRALNAQLARKALKELNGPRTGSASKLNVVESSGTGASAPTAVAPAPPELREALFKPRE